MTKIMPEFLIRVGCNTKRPYMEDFGIKEGLRV